MLNSSHTKKNRNKKNGDNDGKALVKLMNNVGYGKTIEKLRNRIDTKLVSKRKKRLFKIRNQTKVYFTQNI